MKAKPDSMSPGNLTGQVRSRGQGCRTWGSIGRGGRGGGEGGSGTQKFVYQKWPDKSFPFVKF